MSNFTPGPWVVEKDGGQRLLRAPDGKALMCDEPYYPWVPDSQEDWALISAAPEMYEALKAILGFFDSGEFVRDTSHDFEQGWHLRMLLAVKALADAKAALGKAVPIETAITKVDTA
jgi:hypothetical protein